MTSMRIGLTGGIASGKSLVQAAFETLGVPVLDADQVSRDVVMPGSDALAEIAQTFGAEFLLDNGELNRRRLREKVFGDAGALRQLEAITHPRIRARMREWLAAQTAPYCMLSVAILVEAKMHDLVDRVLVVDAPESLQIARLIQRDGIDEALAKRMLSAQTDRETRLGAAHDVLLNGDSVAATEAAVAEFHAFYGRLAATGDVKAQGLRLPRTANSVTIKI
ncbi:dephospho-CoA kinase [Solimonas marina]|uniref:Dephospho-CoA kinase n=1 Tax=Solimonas marina TaxID=2714601 RepID=A0A970B948_9GAMM|nr:dephospho-CoA kinase [Solimonas marina]NKF22944.1 dephospho-CoA kinase [Solimonas marina]